MKARNGFVSNSSASSFIVALPKNIKDENELHKILFGNNRKFKIKTPYDTEKKYDSKQVVKRIFSYLEKHKIDKKQEKDLIDELTHLELYYNDELIEPKKQKENYLTKAEATKLWNNFKKENKEADLYHFFYETDSYDSKEGEGDELDSRVIGLLNLFFDVPNIHGVG